MYEIDPARTDLVEEYRQNPGGPYSPELTLLVNRLRLGPMEERYILVCTKRGREWTVHYYRRVERGWRRYARRLDDHCKNRVANARIGHAVGPGEPPSLALRPAQGHFYS